VTLDEIKKLASAGKFPPLCLVIGSERVLAERAIRALKTAALAESPQGFNDDLFQGSGALSARSVINAARTLPMMARSRFVLVRGLDAVPAAELDLLMAYAQAPCVETCLVLTGDKLDGRSKLGKLARDKGFLLECEPPKPAQMAELARSEAEARGHVLDYEAAHALADALGADLSALDDALERLSLYVGAGKPIEVTHVAACVAHARTESIWSLIDAVGARDVRTALTAASSLLQDREPPLRILALVARQLRTVARMRDALASGLRAQEAAVKAGAPPFKARELSAAASRFDDQKLRRAFQIVAETDLALKGSKVAGARVLEGALLELCR
jgi:DNA polymerase-3 subunit delta